MFLNRHLDIPEDRPAIAAPGQRVKTYGELQQESSLYSKHMLPRTLALILCDNSLECLSFYYCCLELQTVPILADIHYDTDYLQLLLEDYHPKYIWLPSSHALSEAFSGHYRTLRDHQGYLLFETAWNCFPIHDDLALLLPTSGSTGSRKLVRISYRNIYDNTRINAEQKSIVSSDMGITMLPMNFAYGLSFIHMHWFMGAAIAITEKSVLTNAFWQFYHSNPITSFVGVSQTYQFLLKMEFGSPEDTRCLKWFGQAGTRLEPSLRQAFSQLARNIGIPFYVEYGQTECIGVVISGSSSDPSLPAGSIGQSLPSISVSVEQPEENSEMIIHGTSVCLGYAYSYQELSLPDEHNLTLRSGDIAAINSDGYITLLGRKSRFLKLAGIRYSLDAIEQSLQGCFSCCQFACSGTDDMLLICYEGTAVPRNDIEAFLAGKMHLNHSLMDVVHMASLPRNTSGKIDYAGLNALLTPRSQP